MELNDLTVEVRNPSLVREGQLLPTDLVDSTFIKRFNNIGYWEIKLAADSPMAALLRTPGYGIILTGPNGVEMSGPTKSARLTQNQNDLEGTWVITGIDDSVLLNERLAYPEPSNANVSTQSVSHDQRSGSAETVIKGYVDANIGPTAPNGRRVQNLTVETDLMRGGVVTASARFDKLQDLIYPLAQTGQIGYMLKQVGEALVFSTYMPQDRSANIRLDLYNGNLTSTEYNYTSPAATRVIVAGQGEAADRLFVERTNAESVTSETQWGRRIEQYQDARDVADVEKLQQRGDEVLVDGGKTQVAMSVQPSDDQSMRYGYEWNLGDQVTIVINDIEAKAVVTEIGIKISTDGVRLGATVGTPVATDYEAKLIARTEEQQTRISNLERASSGYGRSVAYAPGGGTTGGTQPAWSGPTPITGSYLMLGNIVNFNIDVDFDNITNFGTGHYFLTLPFPATHNQLFSDGCLHDISTSRQYRIAGHVVAGSDILDLWYTASNGRDEPFTSSAPVNLSTADNYHISGSYEIEPQN